MTEQQQNPFVLPGFGQSGSAAQNPLLASMEMMRQTWAGLAAPGGLASTSLATPMTLEDLDKRINDLRAVENWLKMNLAMLSSTIQGMEVQRATIATLKSFAQASGMSTEGGASPLEVALGLKPAAAPTGADRETSSRPAPARDDTSSSGPAANDSAASGMDPDQAADAAQPYADATAAAAQGWWSTMQKQFDMLAAATASSFPAPDTQSTEAGTADPRASSGQHAAKKTADRPAAKKTATPKPSARKRAAPKKTP